MQRDLRIDLLRGIGILMIALDHLAALVQALHPAAFVNPFVTWTRVGWSSAAEFFVFFSGYVVGLVYLKTFDRRGSALLQARALHRAWQIYVANILTLIAVVVILNLAGSAGEAVARVTSVAALAEGNSWVGFLSMRSAPMYFEILHLYVVLLLFAPLVVIAARFNVAATVACSALLWLWVQTTTGTPQWNFNPCAWQLIFVLGAACSIGGVLEKARGWLASRRGLVLTTALLGAALFMKAADKSGSTLPLLGTLELPGTSKQDLGPLRLAHFLVSVVFVFQIVPAAAAISASRVLRSLATVGQRSLECFCASTMLVFAAACVLMRTVTFGPLALLGSGSLIVLLLCAWAPLLGWIKAEPWRRSEPSRAAGKASQGRVPADGLSSLQAPPVAHVDFRR